MVSVIGLMAAAASACADTGPRISTSPGNSLVAGSDTAEAAGSVDTVSPFGTATLQPTSTTTDDGSEPVGQADQADQADQTSLVVSTSATAQPGDQMSGQSTASTTATALTGTAPASTATPATKTSTSASTSRTPTTTTLETSITTAAPSTTPSSTTTGETRYPVRAAALEEGVPVSGVHVKIHSLVSVGGRYEREAVVAQGVVADKHLEFALPTGCYASLFTAPDGFLFVGPGRQTNSTMRCVGPDEGPSADLSRWVTMAPDVTIAPDAIRLQPSFQPTYLDGVLTPTEPVERYAMENTHSGAVLTIYAESLDGDPTCQTADRPVVQLLIDHETTTHTIDGCGQVVGASFTYSLVIQFAVLLPDGAENGLSYRLRLGYESP